MEAVIDVTGIAKTFRSLFRRRTVEALRGVDLSVRPGEIFGLLGPNGAGKTTLVKILLGIGRATAGTARLMGRPVGEAAARRKVGYLPENLRLPDYLTSEGALHYLGALSGMRAAERRRDVPAMLERVGMGGWRTAKVKTYSKGMRQRVGLAQALLHRPRLLILDEPTDGVDPVGRKEIRDLLLAARAEGAAVFLNSHMLSEVERVCDRVAILDRGRILRVGSVDELTRTTGRYVLRVEGDPAAALAALEGLAVRTVDDGSLELAAETAAAMNVGLDRLRSAGIVVAEVRPASSSLEDVFIRTVGHGDGGAS